MVYTAAFMAERLMCMAGSRHQPEGHVVNTFQYTRRPRDVLGFPEQAADGPAKLMLANLRTP
jgi:hypothetical protein